MQTLSCISHMDQAILFAYKYDSMNLSWEMSQDAAVGAYCHICYVDATEDLVWDALNSLVCRHLRIKIRRIANNLFDLTNNLITRLFTIRLLSF